MNICFQLVPANRWYSWLLALIITGCTASRSGGTAGSLPATQLKGYGRYMLTEQKGLELIGSASHTGFSFEGRECRVRYSLAAPGSHAYLQYELDGRYQGRIRIEGSDPKRAGAPLQTLVLKAPGSGTHTVWIYKTGEAMTGPVYLYDITGSGVKSIRKPLMPQIEFIGNSITCGAAADASAMPCNVGEYQDHHNAYDAYGPRVARALGAGYMLSSVSGIGMYRNWNSDGPAMPQVYEKTDFNATGHRLWNFDLFTPRVVSIALGTNDLSAGDGVKPRLPFDSAAFVSRYLSFAELVAQKYPLAQIVLLSSPMVQGNNRTVLENCLQAVKQGLNALHPLDKPVVVYFFKPMQPHGCAGHPSVEQQGEMAEELIPLFRALLQEGR